MSDTLHQLRTRRSSIIEELQQIQSQLADRNVQRKGQRVTSNEYWKDRQKLIVRQSRLQSEISTINRDIHSLCGSDEASVKKARYDRASALIRRLVSIVDRIGGDKLLDVEIDILEEATDFVAQQDARE